MGDLKRMRQAPKSVEDSAPNGLTGIPQSIHCPTTAEGNASEVDQIMVRNFPEARAEVATSIAARGQKIVEDVED